ncbi:MAG TPA: TlpA disulfide reductase family protein [Capillimicrobium sp.]
MSGPLDFPDGPPEEAPPPKPRSAATPAPRPPGASRYGWFVGVVVLLVIAIVSLNAVGDDRVRATGVAEGGKLPPFAAPLALSDLEGDVNVAQRPDSGDAGDVPACEVRGPEVLNVCELAERGPVVLGFLATQGGDCTDEFDRLDRVRRDFPNVGVAVVGLQGDRDELRAMIAEHGWGFPVGYDADGILVDLYGVAVCPHVTFAYPGGEVRGTVLGAETESALRGRFERLVAASRERGWRPPRG